MSSVNKIVILFCADTHLGFDYAVRPRIKRRRRGEDFFTNYTKILQYAADRKVDALIHGGDFFFRSKVPQKIIELAYEPLIAFAEKSAIPTYIIPGNHERSRLPKSEQLTRAGIFIFDKPRMFSPVIKKAKIQIYGFPFMRKIGTQFHTVMEELNWSSSAADIKLLCMHQAIEGARVGPSGYTFKPGKDVISATLLPTDASAILSGHIHRSQILYKETVPVIYPGSVERTSFAEKDETKGLYELHFLKDAEQNWFLKTCRFLKLPARPMHDIILPEITHPGRLEKYILSAVERLDRNAVVRFKCENPPTESFKEVLTSSFIRGVLPAEMNFQFSHSFYNREK